MYVKRDIEKDLINLLNSSVSRIILISGARQTGKTTMLQNFKYDKEKLIINLWDENTEVQSLKNADTFEKFSNRSEERRVG